MSRKIPNAKCVMYRDLSKFTLNSITPMKSPTAYFVKLNLKENIILYIINKLIITAILIKVSSIPIGFLLKLISKEILVLKKDKNIYNYTYIL